MGILEIVIVLAIALVVFGGYFRKRLPEFGRKAGEQTRIGGEKAKELADQASTKGSEVGGKVSEKVGDRFDPAEMGRSAGKHVRDAREFRDSFKDLNPMRETESKPAPAEAPAAAADPKPAPAPEGESEPAPEATPEPALEEVDDAPEETPEAKSQP